MYWGQPQHNRPVEDVKNIILSPHLGQHVLLALKAALAPTVNQIQTLNPAIEDSQPIIPLTQQVKREVLKRNCSKAAGSDGLSDRIAT